MAKAEQFSRLSSIINRLRAGSATLAQLQDYLELQEGITGNNLLRNRRTFLRDKDEIRSLFGIDIQYNRNDKTYFIAADAEDTETTQRVLESFDMLYALQVSQGYSKYVLLEERKPKGTEHFHGLLHAIKNKLWIEFDYEKIISGTISRRRVKPYALKEAKHRWYLLGQEREDAIVKSFGLDRLGNLEISSTRFKRQPIDITTLFRNTFGIHNQPHIKPEKVVIALTPEQAKYIDYFPLHHTQKKVNNRDGLEVRELEIEVNYELLIELRSFGENLTVLEPEHLKESFIASLKSSLANYSKDK